MFFKSILLLELSIRIYKLRSMPRDEAIRSIYSAFSIPSCKIQRC